VQSLTPPAAAAGRLQSSVAAASVQIASLQAEVGGLQADKDAAVARAAALDRSLDEALTAGTEAQQRFDAAEAAWRKLELGREAREAQHREQLAAQASAEEARRLAEAAAAESRFQHERRTSEAASTAELARLAADLRAAETALETALNIESKTQQAARGGWAAVAHAAVRLKSEKERATQLEFELAAALQAQVGLRAQLFSAKERASQATAELEAHRETSAAASVLAVSAASDAASALEGEQAASEDALLVVEDMVAGAQAMGAETVALRRLVAQLSLGIDAALMAKGLAVASQGGSLLADRAPHGAASAPSRASLESLLDPISSAGLRPERCEPLLRTVTDSGVLSFAHQAVAEAVLSAYQAAPDENRDTLFAMLALLKGGGLRQNVGANKRAVAAVAASLSLLMCGNYDTYFEWAAKQTPGTCLTRDRMENMRKFFFPTG